MRTFLLPLTSLVLFSAHTSAQIHPDVYNPLIQLKVYKTATTVHEPVTYPQYTDRAGIWQWFSPDTWVTGFFPSILYALYEREQLCLSYNRHPKKEEYPWLELARKWSDGSYSLTFGNKRGHDQGFLSYPFVHELGVNPENATARDAVNTFAKILASKFNPIVGCTRSRDNPDPQNFQVLIDNMMNIELLFQSADLTNNQTLRDMAIRHADTTMKNQIRSDGSTWHIVEYNVTTGAVTKKRTGQGYSDSSTWTRGQSWAIYGYAKVYSRTKNSKYLKTAGRLGDYFIQHLPADWVVPWDFQGPLTPAPRPSDSSAAMITVNAFLLLSQLDEANANKWLSAALKLLNANVELSWNEGFQSLLSNGTVHWPAGNILTGTAYGDYYFIQAGNELLRMELGDC